jgi:signal peptidase II
VTAPWKSPSVALLLIVASVIVVADQITKTIAIEEIGPDAGLPTVTVIPGFLDFRYVENTGAAFGIFQDSTTMLIFVSIGVVTLLAVLFWKLILYSRLLAFAFGLQFGGAIGNLIDRIRLGYVVDFVDGPVLPVWNIADAGITVGVTILAIVLLFLPDWSDPERGFSAESSEQRSEADEVMYDRETRERTTQETRS